MAPFEMDRKVGHQRRRRHIHRRTFADQRPAQRLASDFDDVEARLFERDADDFKRLRPAQFGDLEFFDLFGLGAEDGVFALGGFDPAQPGDHVDPFSGQEISNISVATLGAPNGTIASEKRTVTWRVFLTEFCGEKNSITGDVWALERK
jgi:hypothetical protein